MSTLAYVGVQCLMFVYKIQGNMPVAVLCAYMVHACMEYPHPSWPLGYFNN